MTCFPLHRYWRPCLQTCAEKQSTILINVYKKCPVCEGFSLWYSIHLDLEIYIADDHPKKIALPLIIPIFYYYKLWYKLFPVIQKIEWGFRPRCCAIRLYWPGTTWDNEMTFGMNHAPAALDILTCSPACYHCAMAASLPQSPVINKQNTLYTVTINV